MLKISIVCGNVNISFTQKTCVTVNSLMMVLQDWSILEWTRDTIYIHLCVTIWFLFYIIAVKGDGGHEQVEELEKHVLYSVSVMFCNCKWMLKSRKLNCKKYKQEVKKTILDFQLITVPVMVHDLWIYIDENCHYV